MLGLAFFGLLHNEVMDSWSSRTQTREKAVAVRMELQTFSRHMSSRLQIWRTSSEHDQFKFFDDSVPLETSQLCLLTGKALAIGESLIMFQMMCWLETRSEPISRWNNLETTLVCIKKTRWTGHCTLKFSLSSTDNIACRYYRSD